MDVDQRINRKDVKNKSHQTIQSPNSHEEMPLGVA